MVKNFTKKAKKGFTLVELVVVVAIIAILSGVGAGVYFGVMPGVYQSAAEQSAVTIGEGIKTNTVQTYSFTKGENTATAKSSEKGITINLNTIAASELFEDIIYKNTTFKENTLNVEEYDRNVVDKYNDATEKEVPNVTNNTVYFFDSTDDGLVEKLLFVSKDKYAALIELNA